MDSKKPADDSPSKEPDSAALGNEGESLEFTPTTSEEADQPAEPATPAPGTPVTPSAVSVGGADNEPISSDGDTPTQVTSAITPGKPQPTKHLPFKALWERINIYLLFFILIIVLSLIAIGYFYFKNRAADNTPEDQLAQQQLSPEALEQLASTGVQVGDPKQVLSIQSNSVFGGTVLVKGELQVAGGLKIGSGSLNVPDMNIGGSAIINDLQTQTLAVASNTAIQGQLSVQQNLTVNGTGTFNGNISTPQLTTTRLQLSGDLILSRHIVAGGSIPGRSNGGALGSGGTSSIGGSDTAGTVSINTGSGASAGCMVTVNFTAAFSSTPHVIITPVGSSAADINYYINRTGSNFSICSSNAPPSNSSFSFDYHIFE